MLSFFRSKRVRILFALTISTLLVTLFFGLRPRRGSDFLNHAKWLQERPGIHFTRYSLIYADLDKQLIKNKFTAKNGFTIEIAIQPENFNKRGFQVILTIHDGEDQDQLLLGQWGQSLIIMNGDDYDHRKNNKRIIYKLTPDPSKKLLLTITSGAKGSNLFVDGKLIKSNKDVSLHIPSVGQPKLTVGNSVYGKHSWHGYVFGLGIYSYELGPGQIEAHHENWMSSKNFQFTQQDHPDILYLFNEKNGDKGKEYIYGNTPLLIPSEFHVLKKIILTPPFTYSASTRSLIQDAAMNYIGFIPLSFIAAAFLFQFGCTHKQTILYTVIFCCCLSLGIEILQSWMPSRSSQSLDVILNTLGAVTGTLIHKRISYLIALFVS